MFKCCRKVEGMTDVVDIVGMGGDGTNTINISTRACILAVASGAKIAKDSSVGVYLYLNMNKKRCCRCMRCLQQVKQEYYLVKNKLESLFGHPEHIKNLILVGPAGFSSESDVHVHHQFMCPKWPGNQAALLAMWLTMIIR
ncbi:uncharacterized protein LOC131221073 isoform X4 [Magnolia sinica]|uniref:uncharacterized protein LOC131221073 isoform X4 n=1 Tax=Magnolia sinica TaxID=86752 RepID=UPI002659E61F|nr:uncharacterized protein LOC131221073 isoform X4 [Magnolia sinica]